MTDDFPSSGMAGLMGGRRLLASAVLHHPPGDHGAAAALRQQPEVSRAGIREEFLYFRVHLLTVGCDSSGFLILLSLMTKRRKRLRSPC